MIKQKMNTKKIIPLTYDFMFKALFGNEKNINILIRLLGDYFNIEYEKLKGKIKILNSELIKNDKYDKKKSVDVIIELNEKEIINIEMNANNNYPGLKERNTAYICKIYSEQYITNEEYYKTKKCIQINFNNFGITKKKKKKVVYKLRDEENKDTLTENLEIHHIDMEYINKVCYNEITKEKLDKWIKIMKAEDIEELRRRSDFMEEEGKMLVDEVERLSSDEHIIGLYDGELHEKKVRRSIINYEVEKGIQKGIQKGIKQGVEQSKKEIILNMLKNNIEPEMISLYTNVSIDKIIKIKNENSL